ncbi:hypothetical protein [Nostoc sp. ChiQUE01b]|uniref:hypothetical protein n=1 Tax=Nostoc sp. ChiQUE01b TaxID=3075376 RepID=UPI002AD2C4A5|nr:hypothetical protein [Nostoc sp. ChiQUE01b]MDZ8260766.1 hypothetical protein [Nostoc sp. ChiQUE01b]
MLKPLIILSFYSARAKRPASANSTLLYPRYQVQETKLAILWSAIAAGAWSIGNALDDLKNSGLRQVSTFESARLAFPVIIYLVKYLSTLNSPLLRLYQR